MPGPYVDTAWNKYKKRKKSKTPRGGFEEMKEVCDGFHAAACE